MKLVFDTNVILDAVASRPPFHHDAEKILLMLAEGRFEGYLTANSITDIYYVVRRSVPEYEARDIIRSLLYSLEIIEVGATDCWQALGFSISDFEDALVASCAEKIAADYIVSRDNAFKSALSPVPVITPQELLSIIDVT